jgi:hypothetical protein
MPPDRTRGLSAGLAGIDVPVDPYRRHIFIAQAASGVPATRIMVIDFESTFYFHREGAGVLFGMGDPDEASTFDTTVQWDFLPKVVDVAVRRLPALGDAPISHAWAGLYEVTPDANPLIGAAPGAEGFFLITGFSGHGFQHAPAAGPDSRRPHRRPRSPLRFVSVRSRPLRAGQRLGRALRRLGTTPLAILFSLVLGQAIRELRKRAGVSAFLSPDVPDVPVVPVIRLRACHH